MAEITEAVVGRLAVELAEKDGFAWRPEFRPLSQPGARIGERRLQLLDEEGQQRYRALARQQLESERPDS